MKILHSGFYSRPAEYIFGDYADADAHVRRWCAERKLRASDGITTESLLAALRRPLADKLADGNPYGGRA